MYFTLILENETGEQVNLSATANQYMTSKIEGLNPPAGTVSTSSYAGMNGSYLNNAFIEKRNVVISFAMRGIGIEKRRHQLYRVVKPSRYIKIWYKTANIDVYAEGYVDPFFSSKYDLKKHPNYKYTAEADKKKNAFDLDRLINRRRRPGPEELCEVYKVSVEDNGLTGEDEDILNYDDIDDPDAFA